jgi:basic membrane protein A
MRTAHVFQVGMLALSMAAAIPALAEPAVIYDMGGKFDKSFNEAAYNGMQKWAKDTGKKYLEFEISNESQREQAVRRMAEKALPRLLALVFHRHQASKK